MALPTPLEGVDQAALTPVVRQLLGRETAEVSEWDIQPIGGGMMGPLTGVSAVYRVDGSALDGDRQMPWSVVLKVVRTAEAAEASDPLAWNVESKAYASGLLADLPIDLVAPRCFGVEERSAGLSWIWLEEVHEEGETKWSAERYSLAARHLGQFSGLYLTSRPLPTLPWLRSDRGRALASQGASDVPELILTNLDKPLIRRAFPSELVESIPRLAAGADAFLDVLDRLPQALCHHDAFRRDASHTNLLSRRRVDGRVQTVAIDWAWLGIASIALEIGPLVGHCILSPEIPLSDLPSIEEAIFEGYVLGLRDVGWDGDERLVRLGYAARVAAQPWPHRSFLRLLLDPEHFREVARVIGPSAPTVEEFADRVAVGRRRALRLTDEARELLPLIS